MSLIIPKKPQILYAPMLGSLGGGSVRGFGRGVGGEELALPTPAYTNQGPNQYLSNYGDPWITTSQNIGMLTSSNVDSHNSWAADAFGDYWYIAANWSYDSGSNLGPYINNRWGGKNCASLKFQTSWKNYTTAGGVDVYTRNIMNPSTKATGTAAGIFDSTVMSEKGSFFTDARSFGNGSDWGWASWYTDTKSDQYFPDVHTAIYNFWFGVNTSQFTKFDGVSQGNDSGGAVYWTPIAGASEVLIDFGNIHGNERCALTVWDNSTGTIVRQVSFGRLGPGDQSSGSLNDSHTRVYLATHNPDYVYILSDHAGTVCGSHYFLYR